MTVCADILERLIAVIGAYLGGGLRGFGSNTGRFIAIIDNGCSTVTRGVCQLHVDTGL